MLKKTITYENYDGEQITEDFYFNLSKADLVELEVSRPGGLGKHLEAIGASNDGGLIIATFKDLLKKSYGKKSEDGKRFVKNDELWEEFISTEAYSTLFMELVTDAEAAAAFVNGIVPANLEAEAAKINAAGAQVHPLRPEDGEHGPRKLTQEEVEAMDGDELKSGLATGRYKL